MKNKPTQKQSLVIEEIDDTLSVNSVNSRNDKPTIKENKIV